MSSSPTVQTLVDQIAEREQALGCATNDLTERYWQLVAALVRQVVPDATGVRLCGDYTKNGMRLSPVTVLRGSEPTACTCTWTATPTANRSPRCCWSRSTTVASPSTACSQELWRLDDRAGGAAAASPNGLSGNPNQLCPVPPGPPSLVPPRRLQGRSVPPSLPLGPVLPSLARRRRRPFRRRGPRH